MCKEHFSPVVAKLWPTSSRLALERQLDESGLAEVIGKNPWLFFVIALAVLAFLSLSVAVIGRNIRSILLVWNSGRIYIRLDPREED
jgi:hypothetical protein